MADFRAVVKRTFTGPTLTAAATVRFITERTASVAVIS